MGRRMSVVKQCTPHNTIRKFSCNCLNSKDCCQNSPAYKITESFSERIQQYIFQPKHLGFSLIQYRLQENEGKKNKRAGSLRELSALFIWNR